MVVIAILKTEKDILELIKLYLLVQGTVTGGFFGFNFGEHWAQRK